MQKKRPRLARRTVPFELLVGAEEGRRQGLLWYMHRPSSAFRFEIQTVAQVPYLFHFHGAPQGFHSGCLTVAFYIKVSPIRYVP